MTTLTLSGIYCICTFDNLKVTTVTGGFNFGSISLNQNAAITSTYVKMESPSGMFCVHGYARNVIGADANCPTVA